MSLTFKTADHSMREEIAELWHLCFGDPPAYIRFYLDNGFVPEQVLAGFKAGKMVAMLTMIPFSATTPQGIRSGRYVFAVATHPDYQKQGISTALMDEAHRRMAAEGVDFSVLVPANWELFWFYGGRGYETAFFVREYRAEAETIASGGPQLKSARLEDLAPVRNRYFADSALFCGWSQETLGFLGKECLFQGGDVFRFTFEDEQGYVVCYPYGERVTVKECVPAAAADYVLPALHAHYRKAGYVFRLPAGAENGQPFAMLRWYTQPADLTVGSAPVISLVLD